MGLFGLEDGSLITSSWKYINKLFFICIYYFQPVFYPLGISRGIYNGVFFYLFTFTYVLSYLLSVWAVLGGEPFPNVKRQNLQTNHLQQYSAELKNAWVYISNLA